MTSRHGRLHLLIGAAILVWAGDAALGAAPAPAGSVTALLGTLTVQRHGASTPISLHARSTVYVGDRLTAGPRSKATVTFSDGSEDRLAANAVEEVTAPTAVGRGKTGFLRQLFGQVWHRLRPGKAVQTPSANAGVGGTEFLLQVDADGTSTLTVLAGDVDFFNARGAVDVAESQQSVVRLGEPPTAPVTIPNPALMIEWTLDLDRAFLPSERFLVTPDRKVAAAETPVASDEVQAHPDDSSARLKLGDDLFDSGKPDAALEQYRRADNLAPGRASTLSRVGAALLEIGQVDEAQASYQAALAADSQSLDALIGIADVELTRNRPSGAEDVAQKALAIDPQSVRASTDLGVARMRRPGKLPAAVETLRAALDGEPAIYRYQAQAWLALALLAQDDRPAALQAAEASVKAAPSSALAHASLSLICFFNGQTRRAEREARLATKLNPESVAALCALGQAQLAQGDTQAADRTAARAVALDPSLPQALYLLGVADAQLRKYHTAARELDACLRLAPDFLPAASALARVDLAMGRKREAVALLQDLLPRHPDQAAVHSALGAVYYQQARYDEAIAEYQQAVKLQPASALSHAELCRVFIDANRLNEAILQGRDAVQLSPDVGQFHAILGLAYDFSHMAAQSEREYREALALDPRNALAHLVLGLKAASVDPSENRIFPRSTGLSLEELVRQGLRILGSNFAVGSIAQASLYDPAVVVQTLRGGTDSALTGQGGNESQLSGALTNHYAGADGAVHTYGLADRSHDAGMRANDDTGSWDVSEQAAWASGQGSVVFGRGSHREIQQGLPGLTSAPDLDDRSDLHDSYLQLATRQQAHTGSSFWGSVSYRRTTTELTDPDQSSFPHIVTDPNGSTEVLFSPGQTLITEAVVPEIRADFAVDRQPGREAILSLGAGRAPVRLRSTAQVTFNPEAVESIPVSVDADITALYAQWSQSLSDRLSLVAQLRYQRLTSSGAEGILGGGTKPVPSAARSYWLPGLLINFRPDRRTLLRLQYNRQAEEQDLAVFALTPFETVLVTEPLVMSAGLPNTTETAELDAERYLGPSDFVKVFVFRTTADGVDLGNLPTMQTLRRYGVGVRYERQLTDRLFGQLGFVLNRTTNDTPFAPFDAGSAPYHPWRLGGLGLNYVDPSGNKVGLQINYTGPFFQDTGAFSATTRPVFGSHVYVDLLLAREPSVDREFFARVSNLFDTPAIMFNDSPIGTRTFVVGLTLRR